MREPSMNNTNSQACDLRGQGMQQTLLAAADEGNNG